MPDIVQLNGGLVRSTPDLTDLLPVQDSQGITHPATLAGVVALTLASANFTARVNQLIGAGGGGIADGDKGDITVSGSGGAWSIDANAVTLAKMAPVATSRLLGRASAGAGSVEAITIGTGLTLAGTTLSSTAVSGGSGDMLRSIYDVDNNGVVDNTQKLDNYLPSYYLDRANHTGIIIGTGLSPWTTKTANYTAIAGDRLRVNATAGDVVITLPASPTAADADIWLQRLDTSANKVLIRSGNNKLNALAAEDGVFAPTVIQAIERLSYVDATIGWLGQYDRLTYQPYVAPVPAGSDPLFSMVKLLLNLDGNIIDRSPTPKTFTNNGATFAAANPFGTGQSLATAVTAHILGTSVSDFVIPANTDFCFEGFVQFTGAFGTSGYNSPSGQYFFGLDSQALTLFYNTYNSICFGLNVNQSPAITLSAPTPALNRWHFWQVQRASGAIKAYFNEVELGAATNNSAIGTSGQLLIASVTAGGNTNYAVVGNSSNVRLTVGNTRPTARPIAPFPIS